MKKNEYQCAICGGIFNKGWTDEEVLEELDENFPGIPIEECELVCDDCFKKITSELPIEEFHKKRKENEK